jgi:hypothetical protein
MTVQTWISTWSGWSSPIHRAESPFLPIDLVACARASTSQAASSFPPGSFLAVAAAAVYELEILVEVDMDRNRRVQACAASQPLFNKCVGGAVRAPSVRKSGWAWRESCYRDFVHVVESRKLRGSSASVPPAVAYTICCRPMLPYTSHNSQGMGELFVCNSGLHPACTLYWCSLINKVPAFSQTRRGWTFCCCCWEKQHDFAP